MKSPLGRVAVRGVFWTGLGQLLRQLVQVAGSIVLARLLVPEDFGLLGMALFFVGIGQLFADFGVGSAIVQSRSDDRVVLSSCFWLNVGVAGTLAVVLLAASPLIAAFYKRADLVPLIAALSVNLLLAGLQAVPSALLYRQMRFAAVARAQVLGSVAGVVAAIALALTGSGVWALVAQPLIGSTTALAVCLVALRWRPHFEYSWAKVRPLARFSFLLLGTNLVGYANRNYDSLLIGRFLGAQPLGIYSMAIQLMLYPLQQVSSVIVRVLFPTLVQMGDDPRRMRSAYLTAVSAIAIVTFPMMGGLFAVADDVVAVVFGRDWMEMAPVVKVLAWVGMMQSIATTVGTIYLSTGKPGIAFRVSIIAAPVLLAGIAAGLPWGILGVAWGYAAASVVLFYYTAVNAFGLIELQIRDFHAVLWRTLVATLAMVATVVAAVALLQSLRAPIRLGIAIATGIVAYAAFSIAVNRKQFRQVMDLLKLARQKEGV
jgi:O-antigen/teichoic acid export membrane protein